MAMHNRLYPTTQTRMIQTVHNVIDFNVSVFYICTGGGVIIGGVTGGILGMYTGIQVLRDRLEYDRTYHSSYDSKSFILSIVTGSMYIFASSGIQSIGGCLLGGTFGILTGLGFPFILPYGVYMGCVYVTEKSRELMRMRNEIILIKI